MKEIALPVCMLTITGIGDGSKQRSWLSRRVVTLISGADIVCDAAVVQAVK